MGKASFAAPHHRAPGHPGDRRDRPLRACHPDPVIGEGAVDLELIEASAPGLEAADAIFVFGTLHTTPADVATDLYRRGYADVVVLTGGECRDRPGHHEARRHRDMMLASGVPEDALVVEDRSTSTLENVTMALPLLRQRLSDVRTVIAVVKWFHRRALVTLARHSSSVERIYAATYEPFDPLTGKLLQRSTWDRTSPRSVARETAFMRALVATGVDPLTRDGRGWVRTTLT